MTTSHTPPPSASDRVVHCTSCALSPRGTNRRDFLQRAGMLAAALVLAPSVAGAGQGEPADVGPLSREAHDGGSERRYAIPAADAIQIDKDNSVMIARASGRAYAFSLACPHQNTALRWEAEDHEFRCPKHKSRYRPDGTFIDGRATRAMDRLAVRRDGDALVVDVDVLYRQDENPAQWGAAFVAL
jgi:nitrite reductase/ring-hydroxylating ferredoxin subunit